MNTLLTGKNIIITGGSNGLGKSIAQQLNTLGANVIIIGRNKEKMELLKKEGIHYYVCDVTDNKQLNDTFQTILSTHGVDILINNAGIRHQGPTQECGSEMLSSVLAVNTEATIRATQQVIPYMKEHKSGQILNVVSLAGIDKCPNRAIYGASKAAITHFTNSTQEELKEFGIKVMGIYPGGMNTGLFATAGNLEGTAERMMDKEDVAKIAINMLSQPSDIIMSFVEVRKFL